MSFRILSFKSNNHRKFKKIFVQNCTWNHKRRNFWWKGLPNGLLKEKKEEILNLGRESKRSCHLQHKLKATVFYLNPSDNFVIFTLQVNSKIIYDIEANYNGCRLPSHYCKKFLSNFFFSLLSIDENSKTNLRPKLWINLCFWETAHLPLP